jgi:hypothetical protein
VGSQGLISALVQALLLAPVPDLDAAGLARHSLTAGRRTLDPEAVWGKFARDSPLEGTGFELPVPRWQ